LIPKKLINLVKEDVRLWSKHFLEVPNVQLNNLPACPYAKTAWLQNKVNIQLRDPDKGYVSYLHKLIKNIALTNFKKLLINLTINIILMTIILWAFILIVLPMMKTTSF